MDDIIVEFVTETMEGLALVDQELVKLEKNSEDKTILGNIFRVMHTIKGACGFLGYHRLEKVAHAGEDILGKFRDGELKVTPHAVTLILQSTDRIKSIIDYISENGREPEGDDNDLITGFKNFTGGEASSEQTISNDNNTENDFSSFFKGDDDLDALIKQLEEEQAASAKLAETIENKLPAKIEPVITEQKEAPVSKEPALANQSIRVSIDVLEKMMQMVGELVLSRNQLMQIARTDENQKFLSPLQQLSHITSELQDSVMKTRMQPIGSAWQKFPRLVRDLSLELGKKIELKMLGEDTELDRQLLEAVKDPLTHMVRNSCDHGIETLADRKASGKSETGTVTLNAYHDGGHIVIEISDDGKGINIERVKEKALANGLVTQAELANLSERQILQFIFAPGFSTAEKVSAVSGRGVGMDVVRTNVEKIGGTIDLFSTPGKGSRVSIKIPLTLAIVSVLIVEKAGQCFALPQINVQELIQLGGNMPTKLEVINNATVIRLRESLLPVISLSDVLKLPADEPHSEKCFVVVCNVGGMEFGVIVDRIHNIEEIVVKPVSRAIKAVPLFAGNTILGDGKVIMILDPNSLAKEVGEIKLNEQRTDHSADNLQAPEETPVNFLLFSYGSRKHNAIPLELVWRLEELSAHNIEYTNGQPVIQYRGKLMQILTLNESYKLPESGIMPVIVFSYDEKIYGLPVDKITDIVEVPFKLQLSSHTDGMLGSMVIKGHATDIVDISNIINKTIESPDTTLANKEKSVLLVDDSPFFVKMIAPLLIAAGYRLTTELSAIQALARLRQNQEKFDLIITDINMPVMDGFRFAEECHTTPQGSTIPIIGCSSTMNPDMIKKSKQSGMVTCIPKNNRSELLAIMASNCNRIGA